MPQFTISVSGLTPDDAVDGILALASRFQGNAAGAVAADVSEPAATTRRRKASVAGAAGPGEPVLAAAHPEAAGGLSDGALVTADAEAGAAVGGADVGAAGTVAAGAEASGQSVDPLAALAGGQATQGQAGEARSADAAVLPDLSSFGLPVDEVDGAGRTEVTLEVVQGLAKALGAKAGGGIGAVQAIFKEAGVSTPADIDPAKLIALANAFDKALAA